jgi:hypothetical protein
MLMQTARAFFTGPLDEAEALAARTLTLRPAAPTNNVMQFFAVQTFHFRAAQGRLAELRDVIADWAARPPALPIWRCGLALVEARSGRPEAAAAQIDALAADDFAALPLDANWLPALVALAQAADAIGHARHAPVLYRLLLPYAASNVLSGTTAVIAGPVELVCGVLALLGGDPQAAVDHLERAIERATRMGARPSIAMGELDLARALEARNAPGDRARASALRASDEAARRLGWTGLAPVTDAAPAAPPPARHATLRREGDYWTLACGAEMTRLKDTKGVRHLQTLLGHPGREFHALDLVGGEGVRADEGIRAGDAGEVLDGQARATYRARLRAIEADVESAMEADDFARADELRAEQAALERELARATGVRQTQRGGQRSDCRARTA